MATKGESRRAEEQRRGPTPKAKKRAKARKTRAEKFATPHEMKRAGKKATYALEGRSPKGRASRKSTRASANRAKPDAALNRREEGTKGSPANLSRKARVRGARVRGSSAEH